jgi:formylglycine-generating enzyme required for sulfatase activity
MSADVTERLRSLAQDYHDGRLDLAAYRSLRAPLLDSLVPNAAATAAVAVTQPRTVSWQTDEITRPGKPRAAADASATASSKAVSMSVPSIGARSATSPDPAPTSSRGAKPLPLAMIAIGAALIVVLALALWMLDRRSTATDAAAVTRAASETVDADVSAFLDRADWSDGSLVVLNATLLERGQSQVAAATRNPGFQRFVDELRRRLKEQQALAAAPLSADTSPIAALAVTVGLDLSSPDAAIHIAALPPPPVQESTPATNPQSVRPATSASAAHGATGTAQQTASVARAAEEDASSPSAPTSTDVRTTADAKARADARTPADANGRVDVRTTADAKSHTDARANAAANPAVSVTAVSNASDDACRVELIGSRRPFCHDMVAPGVAGPSMALIPAGAFEMGSTAAADEQPVHPVTIREPFAISVYEVSQAEFAEYCQRSGRSCPRQPWSGDDYPVVNVSWDDARAYVSWLSIVTHQRYALPTEAQWEYAARAGRTGLFPSGDTLSPTDAHYSMLTKQTVGARRSQKFNANAFRLMHTVGNVREWVEDAWTQTFASAPNDGSAATPAQSALRVARGGSYTDGAARLRLSLREGLPATTRDATTGFRVIRELP